jgi:voltage-gated potassium channel Kch
MRGFKNFDAAHRFCRAFDEVRSFLRPASYINQTNSLGYNVVFGDFSDPRIWEPVALHGRKVTVLTAPIFEVSRELGPAVRELFPDLKRVAVVRSQEEAERFRSIGVLPVIDRSMPPGLDLAALVLAELGVDSDRIGDWMRRQQERALSGADAVPA